MEALERKSIGILRLEVLVLLSVSPMLLYYSVPLSRFFFREICANDFIEKAPLAINFTG